MDRTRTELKKLLSDTTIGTFRYPVTSELKFVVQHDGIYEKQYEYDQFGEIYTEYSNKVMSRDAFVEAFEKYIKKGDKV